MIWGPPRCLPKQETQESRYIPMPSVRYDMPIPVFDGPVCLPELSKLIIEGRNFYLTDFFCHWSLLQQRARFCVCVDHSATTVLTISLLVGSDKRFRSNTIMPLCVPITNKGSCH